MPDMSGVPDMSLYRLLCFFCHIHVRIEIRVLLGSRIGRLDTCSYVLTDILMRYIEVGYSNNRHVYFTYLYRVQDL